jgi:hypothetical protein
MLPLPIANRPIFSIGKTAKEAATMKIAFWPECSRALETGPVTACLGTISVPHPFAFFLAKGWESAKPNVRNHAVGDLTR